MGHWRQQERKGDGSGQLGEAGPPLMRQMAYGAEVSGKVRGWGADKPDRGASASSLGRV